MQSNEGTEPAPSTGTSPPVRSILFVCTGNTCRSPLAEALARHRLAERLGCPPDELAGRGYVVRSAGIAAFAGDPASPAAVEVARELGVDLGGHRSRPLNPELLAEATDVVAMTRGHAVALLMRFPGVGPAPSLLGGSEPDLDDPIGGELDVYRECARTIARHLDRLITEWTGT